MKVNRRVSVTVVYFYFSELSSVGCFIAGVTRGDNAQNTHDGAVCGSQDRCFACGVARLGISRAEGAILVLIRGPIVVSGMTFVVQEIRCPCTCVVTVNGEWLT